MGQPRTLVREYPEASGEIDEKHPGILLKSMCRDRTALDALELAFSDDSEDSHADVRGAGD